MFILKYISLEKFTRIEYPNLMIFALVVESDGGTEGIWTFTRTVCSLFVYLTCCLVRKYAWRFWRTLSACMKNVIRWRQTKFNKIYSSYLMIKKKVHSYLNQMYIKSGYWLTTIIIHTDFQVDGLPRRITSHRHSSY